MALFSLQALGSRACPNNWWALSPVLAFVTSLCDENEGTVCPLCSANITSEVPAKPFLKVELVHEIWVQVQMSPKQRKEDKFDSSGLWLPPLLQWNYSGCYYKANNDTTTFYSSVLLCWKDWVWPSPSLDKPLSCESCFDLCQHLTGSRWPKESIESSSLPAPDEHHVFLARSLKQQFNVGHPKTL